MKIERASWTEGGGGEGGGLGLFFGRDGSVPQNKAGVFFWQERVKFVRLAVQMLKISLIEMQNETSQGHKIGS